LGESHLIDVRKWIRRLGIPGATGKNHSELEGFTHNKFSLALRMYEDRDVELAPSDQRDRQASVPSRRTSTDKNAPAAPRSTRSEEQSGHANGDQQKPAGRPVDRKVLPKDEGVVPASLTAKGARPTTKAVSHSGKRKGNQRPQAKNASSAPVLRNGWLSPVYASSRQVSLDPAVLEKNRIVSIFPNKPEANFFRLLRTQIHHKTKEKGWNTLMVTSPRAGDGKTSTTINLAMTFAREYNHTALLVDCDLKKQAVHKTLGYESASGIADYLMGDQSLQDLIVWPGIEKLSIISGGRTIQDSTEMLASQRMQVLVNEMKYRYKDRFIFFDTPPLLEAVDAIAFAPMIDCVIMVVREGLTTMGEIQKALHLIPQDKFLGFVMNRLKKSNDNGAYYYGHYR
jgi:non-specific protein-tyrosine kinase